MRIAINHLSIKIISRGKGKSAVAAAAYRAGALITSQYDGITHDYTRKGGVVHTEILLPDHAPAEYSNRATLWNAVEKAERNKNAQLAREIEVALPVELPLEQSTVLIREYVNCQFVSAGMCADICLHDKGDGNPHAHIMLTLRPFNEDGTWAAKSKKEYDLDCYGERIRLPNGAYKTKKVSTVDWNEPTKAEVWRSAWADIVNIYLERGGHAERIDHRSYERQGVEQIPSIHLGAVATQMERRGIRTERGDINREIEITNRDLRQLRARIKKLQIWVKDETANVEPPALADVVQGLLSRKEHADKSNRYASISNLKAAAKIMNFLTENRITDMAGLNTAVSDMRRRFDEMRDSLRKADRRLDTLAEHLRHSENIKSYRGYKAQYEKLHAHHTALQKDTGFIAKGKTQKALAAVGQYYETHRAEIVLYDAAERYLRDVMRARFDPKKLPPIAAWTAERDKLIDQRKQLYTQYTALKDDTRYVEHIKRGVENILRDANRNSPRIQTQRTDL